jgi:transglutaminase-like putative cysteine protease
MELTPYLKSTLYLDWHNPAVRAAALNVPCDSDKTWDLALALWKYVDKTILTKNLEVAFDPASNVLATGKGDCTEHAVLLAALARARGLPSRVLVGLTQVPGTGGNEWEFGYHAWTEGWIDGTWVSLDAALRQAPVDVTHIALGLSSTDSPDPLRSVSTALVQMIGNIQIEVLNQE